MLKNLPNFLCIGAQKSGTTLLYELLKKIEDIYLPSTKEIHFFDEPSNTIKDTNWYVNTHFKNVRTEKVIGEITPSYIFFDDIPKKIYSTLGPNVKFIVLLRNPVERAYSHYIMRYRKKEENLSFEESLKVEEERISKNIDSARKYSYSSRGFYFKQIENYFKYFDKKQFLFIEFNQLTNYQDESIHEICNFLKINKNIKIKNKKIHSSKLSIKEKFDFLLLNKRYSYYYLFNSRGYPPIDKKMKEILENYYREDVRKLEKLINKNLSEWFTKIPR